MFKKLRKLFLRETAGSSRTTETVAIPPQGKDKPKPVPLFGQPIDSFDPTPPLFLRNALRYIEERGLEQTGLFRVSGNIHRINALKKQLNEGASPTFENADIHVVANLIKIWLRELPEPLLTFDLYDAFVAVYGISDMELRKKTLHNLVLSLPIGNLNCLRLLMAFLYKVHQFSDRNLMNVNNLAIVFAPNLLRPRLETLERLIQDAPACNEVVALLILTQEDYQQENFVAQTLKKNPERVLYSLDGSPKAIERWEGPLISPTTSNTQSTATTSNTQATATTSTTQTTATTSTTQTTNTNVTVGTDFSVRQQNSQRTITNPLFEMPHSVDEEHSESETYYRRWQLNSSSSDSDSTSQPPVKFKDISLEFGGLELLGSFPTAIATTSNHPPPGVATTTTKGVRDTEDPNQKNTSAPLSHEPKSPRQNYPAKSPRRRSSGKSKSKTKVQDKWTSSHVTSSSTEKAKYLLRSHSKPSFDTGSSKILSRSPEESRTVKKTSQSRARIRRSRSLVNVQSSTSTEVNTNSSSSPPVASSPSAPLSQTPAIASPPKKLTWFTPQNPYRRQPPTSVSSLNSQSKTAENSQNYQSPVKFSIEVQIKDNPLHLSPREQKELNDAIEQIHTLDASVTTSSNETAPIKNTPSLNRISSVATDTAVITPVKNNDEMSQFTTVNTVPEMAEPSKTTRSVPNTISTTPSPPAPRQSPSLTLDNSKIANSTGDRYEQTPFHVNGRGSLAKRPETERSPGTETQQSVSEDDLQSAKLSPSPLAPPSTSKEIIQNTESKDSEEILPSYFSGVSFSAPLSSVKQSPTRTSVSDAQNVSTTLNTPLSSTSSASMSSSPLQLPSSPTPSSAESQAQTQMQIPPPSVKLSSSSQQREQPASSRVPQVTTTEERHSPSKTQSLPPIVLKSQDVSASSLLRQSQSSTAAKGSSTTPPISKILRSTSTESITSHKINITKILPNAKEIVHKVTKPFRISKIESNMEKVNMAENEKNNKIDEKAEDVSLYETSSGQSVGGSSNETTASALLPSVPFDTRPWTLTTGTTSRRMPMPSSTASSSSSQTPILVTTPKQSSLVAPPKTILTVPLPSAPPSTAAPSATTTSPLLSSPPSSPTIASRLATKTKSLPTMSTSATATPTPTTSASRVQPPTTTPSPSTTPASTIIASLLSQQPTTTTTMVLPAITASSTSIPASSTTTEPPSQQPSTTPASTIIASLLSQQPTTTTMVLPAIVTSPSSLSSRPPSTIHADSSPNAFSSPLTVAPKSNTATTPETTLPVSQPTPSRNEPKISFVMSAKMTPASAKTSVAISTSPSQPFIESPFEIGDKEVSPTSKSAITTAKVSAMSAPVTIEMPAIQIRQIRNDHKAETKKETSPPKPQVRPSAMDTTAQNTGTKSTNKTLQTNFERQWKRQRIKDDLARIDEFCCKIYEDTESFNIVQAKFIEELFRILVHHMNSILLDTTLELISPATVKRMVQNLQQKQREEYEKVKSKQLMEEELRGLQSAIATHFKAIECAIAQIKENFLPEVTPRLNENRVFQGLSSIMELLSLVVESDNTNDDLQRTSDKPPPSESRNETSRIEDYQLGVESQLLQLKAHLDNMAYSIETEHLKRMKEFIDRAITFEDIKGMLLLSRTIVNAKKILFEEPITELVTNEEINEFHLRYRQPTTLESTKSHSSERKAQLYSLKVAVDRLVKEIATDVLRYKHDATETMKKADSSIARYKLIGCIRRLTEVTRILSKLKPPTTTLPYTTEAGALNEAQYNILFQECNDSIERLRLIVAAVRHRIQNVASLKKIILVAKIVKTVKMSLSTKPTERQLQYLYDTLASLGNESTNLEQIQSEETKYHEESTKAKSLLQLCSIVLDEIQNKVLTELKAELQSTLSSKSLGKVREIDDFVKVIHKYLELIVTVTKGNSSPIANFTRSPPTGRIPTSANSKLQTNKTVSSSSCIHRPLTTRTVSSPNLFRSSLSAEVANLQAKNNELIQFIVSKITEQLHSLSSITTLPEVSLIANCAKMATQFVAKVEQQLTAHEVLTVEESSTLTIKLFNDPTEMTPEIRQKLAQVKQAISQLYCELSQKLTTIFKNYNQKSINKEHLVSLNQLLNNLKRIVSICLLETRKI